MTLDISIKQMIDIHAATIRYNLGLAATGGPAAAYKVDYFEGPPGIGKTSGTNQAADRVAKDTAFLERVTETMLKTGIIKEAEVKAYGDYKVRPLILAQYEPTDVGGLPWAEKGKMIHLRPNILPGHGFYTLFFDEASKATPKTLNAVGQLLHERMINHHHVGPCVTMAMAGNRRADRSGDNELPRFVWDRVTKYSVTTNKEDWISFAMQKGLEPAIIWFIKTTQDHFQRFDPTEHICPTARSWEKLSNYIQSGLWAGVGLRATAEGTVGPAAAQSFFTFYSLRDKLPDPMAVLSNPKKAPIPEDPQTQYALMASLSSVVGPKTMDGFNQYLIRFDKEANNGRESSVFAVQMIKARDSALLLTDAGRDILERYSEIVLG